MTSAKSSVLEVVNALPNDVSWNEMLYRLQVRRQLEQAVSEADQGVFLTHEEVFRDAIQVPDDPPINPPLNGTFLAWPSANEVTMFPPK